MSQTTALTLLPQTHAVVTGDKQPAACYYVSGKILQTITWKVTGFVGICVIQATLVDDPQSDSDWFTVYNLVCTQGNGNGGTLDNPRYGFMNIQGNFSWLRGVVTSYTSGTLDYFKVSY
jgi:hypothetical protein